MSTSRWCQCGHEETDHGRSFVEQHRHAIGECNVIDAGGVCSCKRFVFATEDEDTSPPGSLLWFGTGEDEPSW